MKAKVKDKKVIWVSGEAYEAAVAAKEPGETLGETTSRMLLAFGEPRVQRVELVALERNKPLPPEQPASPTVGDDPLARPPFWAGRAENR